MSRASQPTAAPGARPVAPLGVYLISGLCGMGALSSGTVAVLEHEPWRKGFAAGLAILLLFLCVGIARRNNVCRWLLLGLLAWSLVQYSADFLVLVQKRNDSSRLGRQELREPSSRGPALQTGTMDGSLWRPVMGIFCVAWMAWYLNRRKVRAAFVDTTPGKGQGIAASGPSNAPR